MKNKFIYYIFALFCLIILLFSFSDTLFDYLLLTLTYLFKFINSDESILFMIFKYILYFMFYFSFGIVLSISLNNINAKRKIMYEILLPIFVLVISMVIKVYISGVNFADYFTKLLIIYLAVAINELVKLIIIRKYEKNR